MSRLVVDVGAIRCVIRAVRPELDAVIAGGRAHPDGAVALGRKLGAPEAHVIALARAAAHLLLEREILLPDPRAATC